MKIKANVSKIAYVLFSLGLLGSSSYFLWNTYDNNLIKTLVQMLVYLSYILMLYFAVKYIRIYRHDPRYAILIYLIILMIHMDFLGAQYHNLSPTSAMLIIAVYMYLFAPDDIKYSLLKAFICVCAILILPSLIYFLLKFVGITVPNTVLLSASEGKVNAGIYYHHYPLGLIIADTSAVNRFCGVFDEPGVVGTLTAFLSILSLKIKVPRFFMILILIEGIFSLSFAFYFIMLIFIMVEAFTRGMIKFGVTLVLFLLLIWTFTNVHFSNPLIAALQERIDANSNILIKNNRTNINFDIGFATFLREGGYPLIMGYGKAGYIYNRLLTGACSYKCIIYDHGIVGAVLYFGFPVFVGIRTKLNKENLSFLVAFLASMYQRPYIYTVLYLFIFILGMSSSVYKENTQKIGEVSREH